MTSPAAPLLRLTATGLSRTVIGLCLLGLVAAILTGLGSAGLGGALGSLFGFGVHRPPQVAAEREAAVTAAPPPAAPSEGTRYGARRKRAGALAPHTRRPSARWHAPPAGGRRPSPPGPRR